MQWRLSIRKRFWLQNSREDSVINAFWVLYVVWVARWHRTSSHLTPSHCRLLDSACQGEYEASSLLFVCPHCSRRRLWRVLAHRVLRFLPCMRTHTRICFVSPIQALLLSFRRKSKMQSRWTTASFWERESIK